MDNTQKQVIQDDSLQLMDEVFTKCQGRSQVKINGNLVGYDREKKQVFIKREVGKTAWMPAVSVLSCITSAEADSLRGLPRWDGSNEWAISEGVLSVIESAINRHLHPDRRADLAAA